MINNNLIILSILFDYQFISFQKKNKNEKENNYINLFKYNVFSLIN